MWILSLNWSLQDELYLALRSPAVPVAGTADVPQLLTQTGKGQKTLPSTL